MQESDVEDRLGSEGYAQGVRIGVPDPTRIDLGLLHVFTPLRSDLLLSAPAGNRLLSDPNRRASLIPTTIAHRSEQQTLSDPNRYTAPIRPASVFFKLFNISHLDFVLPSSQSGLTFCPLKGCFCWRRSML